jgi:hypothetical protein
VHLTGKEYSVLELFSLRKGTTLTKEMFFDYLYGGMDEPELKNIHVFVCKLRKKLARATGNSHYINTLWGCGYVLRDPTELPATLILGAGSESPGCAMALRVRVRRQDFRQAGDRLGKHLDEPLSPRRATGCSSESFIRRPALAGAP